VIEEYQANGKVNTTYTHGWDLISQDNGTNRIYYQVDGLGSTRIMTDNNGAIVIEYDYDAYGNLTRKVGDVNNNYLFAGEQFDNGVNGYYLRARYYDQATGRFASTDPFEGYLNQPLTLHNYLYAANNPVVYIDPSGNTSLITSVITFAFSRIIIGVVSGVVVGAIVSLNGVGPVICHLSAPQKWDIIDGPGIPNPEIASYTYYTLAKVTVNYKFFEGTKVFQPEVPNDGRWVYRLFQKDFQLGPVSLGCEYWYRRPKTLYD
jgi:RHS repeat-associated protein